MDYGTTDRQMDEHNGDIRSLNSCLDIPEMGYQSTFLYSLQNEFTTSDKSILLNRLFFLNIISSKLYR